MDRVICDAIEAKAVVEFDYDGGTRTVEPYCFGVSNADHLLLRGYQIEGFSASGEASGWKLFEVAKIWAGGRLGKLSPAIGLNTIATTKR